MLFTVRFLQTLLNIWALNIYEIYTFDFCYFITKRSKRGTYSKEPNVFFCFTEYKYESTQATKGGL